MSVYTVSFTDTAVTGIVDIFELNAATDKPVELIGLFLAQITDVGESEEEIIDFTVGRGHTTTGSGGGSPTPRPVNSNDPASGFTAETLNTTIATAGTNVVLFSDSWNVRAGYQLILPEGMGFSTAGTALLVVRLETAPSDSITMTGTAFVRELT